MPTQANQPLADGYQLQNYRIRKVLSSGGFSIVYLAHDENDVLMRERERDPRRVQVLARRRFARYGSETGHLARRAVS